MSDRRVKLRRLGIAAAPVLGVASATGAVASYFSSQVIGERQRRRDQHRLLAIEGDHVVLRRDRETERPGTYGLASASAHAVVGDVEALDARSVVRPLLRVDRGSLLPGRVWLDHVHVGDPACALGLDYEAIELAGEAGALPAWVVPGGDSWVVLAHGFGGSLQSSLSYLGFLHDAGHTALVASYRNDPGAGLSRDRRYHLGDEEWRDLDVAFAYALCHGARRLVVFGWSLGAAVALQALARSAHAGAIAGLVLDSAVLDWRRVLRHLGRRMKLPAAVTALTLALVERRIGIDLDAFDWIERSDELNVPILLIHGEDDPTVPFELAATLARRRPELIELEGVPKAGHVGSWNIDPDAYEARVTTFLAQLTDAPNASAAGSGGDGQLEAID